MITFFTDDPERDAPLVQALHATRTLHHVHALRTDADLRTAVVLAIAEPGQLVLTHRSAFAMKKLTFILDLLGMAHARVDEYLSTCRHPAQAGPHDWDQHASVRATHEAPIPCGPPH